MINAIKLREEDNVAVATHDLNIGEEAMEGVTVNEKIPQAHKIALTLVPKGKPVIRYGVVLGYAKEDIKPCL